MRQEVLCPITGVTGVVKETIGVVDVFSVENRCCGVTVVSLNAIV